MGTLKEQLNRTKELMGVLNEQEKQKPIKFKQYIGAMK